MTLNNRNILFYPILHFWSMLCNKDRPILSAAKRCPSPLDFNNIGTFSVCQWYFFYEILGLGMFKVVEMAFKVTQGHWYGAIWYSTRHPIIISFHLENWEITISQRKIIQFWWNLVHNRPFGTRWQSCVQIQIFLIQDGGWLPYWKSLFGHNSAADSQISVKFCTNMQNSMLIVIT